MADTLTINIGEYDMPEEAKVVKIARALALEDADTATSYNEYSVYGVSSNSYGIMF